MMQPEQLALEASRGPDFYTLILGGIGLIIAAILGELVRRLYSNHYRGHAGQLEAICLDIKRLERKVDGYHAEDRESHAVFYDRIAGLETRTSVIESICERLPKGGGP